MEEVDVKSKKRRSRREAVSMDLGSEEDLRAFKKKKGISYATDHCNKKDLRNKLH